jgi:hypothetical protein
MFFKYWDAIKGFTGFETLRHRRVLSGINHKNAIMSSQM